LRDVLSKLNNDVALLVVVIMTEIRQWWQR